VPDAGGQGEQSLGDAGEHSGVGAATVAFEAELVLDGAVDRLDALPDAAQVPVPAQRSSLSCVMSFSSTMRSTDPELLRGG
jgi:hypothetical protein